MGSLDYLVQQTMNAFSLGSIYALVAIGLAMVFGILRLINFAHGDLMMVACYSAFFLITTGIGFVATLTITIIATLLLDEPSLGLAPIMVQTIFAVIQKVRQEGGTVLLVEQNARQALEIADRGYVLETGSIMLEGSARELRTNAAVEKAYLGG